MEPITGLITVLLLIGGGATLGSAAVEKKEDNDNDRDRERHRDDKRD